MNKFKAGDIIRYVSKESDPWCTLAKVRRVGRSIQVIALEASNTDWIGDPLVIHHSHLDSWELDTTHNALEQFDQELEELLK
jgi:hypothetical protein